MRRKEGIKKERMRTKKGVEGEGMRRKKEKRGMCVCGGATGATACSVGGWRCYLQH